MPMVSTETIYKAQVEYCEKNNYPLFAPKDTCVFCGCNVWQEIGLKRAGKELITGCPRCHHTYCD